VHSYEPPASIRAFQAPITDCPPYRFPWNNRPMALDTDVHLILNYGPVKVVINGFMMFVDTPPPQKHPAHVPPRKFGKNQARLAIFLISLGFVEGYTSFNVHSQSLDKLPSPLSEVVSQRPTNNDKHLSRGSKSPSPPFSQGRQTLLTVGRKMKPSKRNLYMAV